MPATRGGDAVVRRRRFWRHHPGLCSSERNTARARAPRWAPLGAKFPRALVSVITRIDVYRGALSPASDTH